MTEPAPNQANPVGPPKSKDRRVIVAMIGTMTAIVPALIAFVTLSDFPGGLKAAQTRRSAPPEDVRG